MTTQEFSDMFDTLLNSYASQAVFGEGASKQEVVLDEYEKSVLLTQAQDIIVKNYFYGNQNPQGQGFDDSIRRQVDFSSLIKTTTLSPVADQESVFDDRGIIFQMPPKVVDGVPQANTTDVLYILNEKLIIKSDVVTPAYWSKDGETNVFGAYTDAVAQTLPKTGGGTCADIADAKNDGWSWNPAVFADKKEFVIVPLNYKEYDRANSKAYAQPFKKQAWRLFQNQSTEFDVQSELIPIWDVSDDMKYSAVSAIYRIRYVKRPDPIVLVELPNGLTIDEFSHVTECKLNPIVHMDILNEAVRIALSTRGRVAAPSRNQD